MRRPFGNQSFSNENLQLLTPQQALADAIALIQATKRQYNCTAPRGSPGYCPVITVGESEWKNPIATNGIKRTWMRCTRAAPLLALQMDVLPHCNETSLISPRERANLLLMRMRCYF